MLTSVSFADRHRGGRDHRDRGGPVVRDHRHGGGDRMVVHDRRDHRGPRTKYVRVNGGRYVFPGGVVRVYKRPKLRRYYDVHVRPPIYVEAYDPVPGYFWVQGNWRWGGGEWIWAPGYWTAEAVVVAPSPPPPPVVQGGVSVSAGISIR